MSCTHSSSVHFVVFQCQSGKVPFRQICVFQNMGMVEPQSQETERQFGSTGRLNRNLYVMLKFTARPKTPEMTLRKTRLFLKRISYLQVTFVLISMKQKLMCLNLQRDRTGNGSSNTKDTFTESLQRQMSFLHRSMCIFKAGLLCLSYG